MFKITPGAPPTHQHSQHKDAARLLLFGRVAAAAQQSLEHFSLGPAAAPSLRSLSLQVSPSDAAAASTSGVEAAESGVTALMLLRSPREGDRALSTRMGGTPISPVPEALQSPAAPPQTPEKTLGQLVRAKRREQDAEAKRIIAPLMQLRRERVELGYLYYEGTTCKLAYFAQKTMGWLPEQPGIGKEWFLVNTYLSARLNPLETMRVRTQKDENGAFQGIIATESGPGIFLDAKILVQLTSLQAVMIVDLCSYNVGRVWNTLSVHGNLVRALPSGWVLPKGFASPAKFCWMEREDSKAPFTKESLAAIGALNFEFDSALIVDQFSQYPKESLDVMRVCYALLKQAAEAGLTPFEIASWFMQGKLREIHEAQTGDVNRILRFVRTEVHIAAFAKKNPELHKLMTTAPSVALKTPKQ